MRREERRNLRRTRKNHRHTFWFLSFFFLPGWRRAETENSRRWENMIFFLLVSLTFDVVYPIGIIVTTFRFLFRSVPLARSLSFLSHFISLLFFINLNYIQLSVSHTRLLENHQYIYANFSDFANFKSLKLKPCARIKKKNFCDTFILSEFPIWRKWRFASNLL